MGKTRINRHGMGNGLLVGNIAFVLAQILLQFIRKLGWVLAEKTLHISSLFFGVSNITHIA